MISLRDAALAAALLLALSGSASAQEFMNWEGKPIIQVGQGGERKIVDGVDFWRFGQPHRFQVIGTIQDSRLSSGLIGLVRMSLLDHDVARLTKQAGGDGVIIASDQNNVVGLSSWSNTAGNGSYGGGDWTGHSSTSASTGAITRRTGGFLVVKYLPDDASAADSATASTGPSAERAPFASSAGHPAWAKANLRFDPTSVIWADDRVLVLRTNKPAATGQLWLREEALSDQGATGLNGRSEMMLAAFDCPTGTFQVRETTRYTGNNLTGAAATDNGASSSVLINPGSMAAAASNIACATPQATASR